MPTEDDVPWFRELYESVIEYKGYDLCSDILTPWTQKARRAVSEFASFKEMAASKTQTDSFRMAMWNLYALGRTNDYLLMPFQDVDGRSWEQPLLNKEQYADFFTNIGFTVFTSGSFSPFRHEVAQVIDDQNHTNPIEVLETLWPGLMFGEMLFSRSGVAVAGGREHVAKQVAENSTLYFTHRRLHRPTADLSMGWGSNSQWRTSFRRDYEHGGKWIYNSDGSNHLTVSAPDEDDRDGLAFEERVELCKHRGFVVTTKDDSDLWPYDDRYEEDIY